MTVTIRGTPVFDGTGATTTASSRAPAITSGTQPGELMVAAICWSGSTITLTDPSGWTLLHKTAQTNDNLAVYYRYNAAGDGAPTLTLSAVCTCIALNVTLQGAVTSGAPVSANVLGGAASTTATYPAITPAHADDLLVYLPGIRPTTASVQPSLSTLPAGGTGGTVTNVAFNSTNVSGSAESGLGILTQQLTAATAVSQETSTISTSSSCDCEALCVAAAGIPLAAARKAQRQGTPLAARRGHMTAVPPAAAAAAPPAFPFTGARQWRQLRGLLPRRGRVTVTVRAQVNPPYPFAVIAQRRETQPRGVPRRGRETFAVPPQPDPAAAVTQRRQAWSRGLPRRGRQARTVPPQLNPPYPVTELRQWRQPRGFWPRRGHGFTPVPAQQGAAPAPVFVPQPLRRARLAALAVPRRRPAAVVPGADVPASRQRRRLVPVPPRRGGHLLAVPAAQELVPHSPRRHLRLVPGPRRGRALGVLQQQAAPPAPVFIPQRSPRRGVAVFWRRARQLMPWAAVPPPAVQNAASSPAVTALRAGTATVTATRASTAAVTDPRDGAQAVTAGRTSASAVTGRGTSSPAVSDG